MRVSPRVERVLQAREPDTLLGPRMVVRVTATHRVAPRQTVIPAWPSPSPCRWCATSCQDISFARARRLLTPRCRKSDRSPTVTRLPVAFGAHLGRAKPVTSRGVNLGSRHRVAFPEQLRQLETSLQVEAGAEPAPGSGEYDCPRVAVRPYPLQGVVERTDGVERHRVHPLGGG